jgi:precorrin-6Y C5,15-methyltransferase (decarboxylating)
MREAGTGGGRAADDGRAANEGSGPVRAERAAPGVWLTLVGVGEDGVEGLSAAARAAVAQASLVVGGARHLALVGALVRGEAMAWPQPMADGYPAILARRGAAVAVLASGDPFWFGVGGALARLVPRGEMRCLPGVSAISLACARLGWSVQEAGVVSLCGRPVATLRPWLRPGARLVVLSAGADTPREVAGALAAHGFAASVLHVMEALGGARERVRSVGARGFALDDVGALNLVAVDVAVQVGADGRGGGDVEGREVGREARQAGGGWPSDTSMVSGGADLAPGLPLTPGLPDAMFEHDGQITKSEIRAATLAALAPRRGETLWDVGCGSGSVAIEWMLRDPAMRAVAVDVRADRAARAARNAEALGVPGLEVRVGAAPGALRGLARPDAVFLGGGAAGEGVVEAAWAALPPGGRLVANSVTVETDAVLLRARAALGGTMVRIGVERLDRIGGMHGFRPAMSVTQLVAVKR